MKHTVPKKAIKGDLHQRLENIQKVFSVDEIQGRPDYSIKDITNYYHTNQWAYSFFHSKEGFVHMGISQPDGVLRPEDLYAQADAVATFIVELSATRVLELAAGKGVSLRYLANKFPEVQFEGLDLPNGQFHPKSTWPSNISAQFGDYHDLSRYDADSFDCVYIVEALCYSTNKQKVLKEVYRILRPGGRLLIFDGYAAIPTHQRTPEQALLMELTLKGMMVGAVDATYDDLKKEARSAGFVLYDEQNLKNEVMPSMKKHERVAAKLFRYPALARLVVRLTGTVMSGNVISGYLMAPLTQQDMFLYMKTVLEKPEKRS